MTAADVMTMPIATADAAADATAVLRHLTWMRQRGLRERTIEKRRTQLARLRATLGPATLLAASADDLAGWRANLAVLEPCTISSYVSHAHQFYAWAVQAGLLLGHADPATTAAYAAWDRAQAPQAVGALPCPPSAK